MWLSLISAMFIDTPPFRVLDCFVHDWMFLKWIFVDAAEFISKSGKTLYRIGIFDPGGVREPSFVPPGLIINRSLNGMGSGCCLSSLCAESCHGYLCSRIIRQPLGSYQFTCTGAFAQAKSNSAGCSYAAQAVQVMGGFLNAVPCSPPPPPPTSSTQPIPSTPH